jgi:Xaa-Pro aminopeptidase
MRTLHSVLKHGGLFWDRDLLPPGAYTARYARIQAAMGESGDDAWLVFGDIAQYGNLTYFTNFLPRVRSAMAYLPREGAPILYASVGLRDIPSAKALTWVDEMRVFGRVPSTIAKFIADEGLERGRIGLVGFDESMPIADWDAVAEALPNVAWQKRPGAFDQLRACKDEAETGAMRAAAEVAHAALEGAPGVLKPGATMRQALAQLDGAARRRGAEDVRILAASGPQSGISLRPPDDRILEEGDSVLVHFAVECQRYWAEVARTYVAGRGNEPVHRLHAKAEAALTAMEGAATAGSTIGAIAAAARDAIGDADLAARAEAYGFAHGIGLDAEEFPLIGSHDDTPISAGTTLALRVILHEEGSGAAAGKTVLVGADAPESLTRTLALP